MGRAAPQPRLPSPTAGELQSRGPHPPRSAGGDVRPLDRAPAPPQPAAPGARDAAGKPVPLRDTPAVASRAGGKALEWIAAAARHQGEARPGGVCGIRCGTPAPLPAQPRPQQGLYPLPRGIAGRPASLSCPSPPESANRPRLPRPHLPESITGVRSTL